MPSSSRSFLERREPEAEVLVAFSRFFLPSLGAFLSTVLDFLRVSDGVDETVDSSINGEGEYCRNGVE